MSASAFRVLRKKIARNSKQQDKSSSQLTGEPAKRKSHSVSNPPEHMPISPSHGSAYNRKPSSTDSPSHRPNILIGVVAGRKDSHPTILSQQNTSLPLVTVIDDSAIRERQDIIDITADVQNFLASVSQLKQAMEDADNLPEPEECIEGQEPTDIVLKHLSELVQVVQTCLEHNSHMQSTDIKNSAKNLMQSYRECGHVSASSCTECNGAIDALIDAFTGSVSEYLTGEAVQLPTPQRKVLEKSPLSTAYLKGFSKSHDNLAGRYNSYLDLTQPINNEAIVDQIDHALAEVKESVVTASKYLKTRLKYHREITSYLNKRAQIEARYHQQMAKLGKSTQQALEELQAQEPCLPMVDTFKTSIEQDMKFASNCNTTYNLQVGSKLIDPLETKCSEYEKKRKEFSQTWLKEQKKLSEARNAMKSAKSRYMFLGQDLVKIKNLLAMDPYGKQADKRKKEVADTEQRWHDSEVAYKQALHHCNDCQYQVHVTAKKSILCAYRRIMIDADTQLQSGLETYFTLQHNFFQTLTEPMVTNIGVIQEYDVGSEFMRYIERQPHVGEELEDYLFEEFDPEATEIEAPNGLSNSDSTVFLPNESTSSAASERPASPNILAPVETSHLDGRHTHSSPRPKRERPWSEYLEADSKPDPRRLSDLSFTPSKERTTSPSLSMTDQTPMSRNAMAHSFKKLKGPARCRECDTYVYFHGSECETCGLACHRNCLATLAIKCGTKRLGRKMNTFGVDFAKHLKATKRCIPIIVTECIAELDLRGLDTRGLYRVSSGKSKLEHLCQLFETGGDRVDLSDRPAHLIGSCLKLYFRQLPEPLLTFGLYQDLIDFARESSYVLPCNDLSSLQGERADSALGLLERLKGLLQKLPPKNYVTLAKLLYHLKRVSSSQHVKNNFMPPSNLGIVFAPNLLRQREVVPSLKLLADMTAQAKAVEIMISHVDEIIHVSDEDIMEQDAEDTTQEVLVDEPVKSPTAILDVDDAMTMESRTPNTTPPERRRENVSELSDVLNALEMYSRRNSQPSLSLLKLPHPQLGEVRNSSASTSAPVFSNLPPQQVGGENNTLAALGRLLRNPTHTPPIEKMLTPVKEGMVETDTDFSDDEQDILMTGSQKLDNQILSRSESGASNPISWTLFDADSEVSSLRDSLSMLSTEGDDSLPRGYRTSAVSLNGTERKASKEDIVPKPVLLSIKSSSQGSDDSPTGYSANNGILYSPPSPPSSLGGLSSNEGTPFRSTQKNTNKNNSTLRSYPVSKVNALESPESTLKPNKSDKYERYNVAGEPELAIEQSQGSTQDSVGTLTDGGRSDGEESESRVPVRKSSESKKTDKWDLIGEIQKQLNDSGIDERGSPDTRSNSLKRSSLPEAVLLREYRHSSEPVVFDSRESGLADSPDSESLLSADSHPLNGPHSPPDAPSLVTHVLRSPTEIKPSPKSEPLVDNTVCLNSNFSSSEPTVSSQPDLEEFAAAKKPPNLLETCSQETESIDSEHDFLIDITPGPRSLESPLFSSIARNPLRHAKTVDYDFGERRHQRAATIEPASLSPEHRAPSLRTRSHTVVSPVHSTNSATSSDSDLTLARSGLSRSLGALATPSPTDSPSNSLKKKNWGKRFTNSIRPALRVLRITPNNSSAALEDPAVRDIHLSSHTPENSPSPKELEGSRARMMSPETVLMACNKEETPPMKRSASFDDVLESTKQKSEAPISIGPLKVVPEKKQKKNKLFSSFQGAKFRSKSKDQTDSPPAVVLVSARKKKVSVDSALAENYSRSPKTKKKSRLPHFV